MGRARCTCVGQCGSDHPGGRCNAPEGVQIVRSRQDPARWQTADTLRQAFDAEHTPDGYRPGTLPSGEPLGHYLQGSRAAQLAWAPYGPDVVLQTCRHCRRNVPTLDEPPPDLAPEPGPAMQVGLFG